MSEDRTQLSLGNTLINQKLKHILPSNCPSAESWHLRCVQSGWWTFYLVLLHNQCTYSITLTPTNTQIRILGKYSMVHMCKYLSYRYHHYLYHLSCLWSWVEEAGTNPSCYRVRGRCNQCAEIAKLNYCATASQKWEILTVEMERSNIINSFTIHYIFMVMTYFCFCVKSMLLIYAI